jgi:uncharacterized membrane protein YkoI
MTFRGTMIIAALAALGFASPAFAADSGQNQPSSSDAAALEKSRVSLPDAVHSAEQKTGGKAVDASFDTTGPAPVYNVKVFQNGALIGVAVDAMSGDTSMGSSGAGQMDSAGMAQAASMQNANVSLGQATQKAEQQTGGKAIDAGSAQTSSARPAYVIDVMANGALQRVVVDPTTGAVQVVRP